MWSFPGFIWRSRSLSLMLGLSVRWSSARGWVIFSLREHEHCDVALQIPPQQNWGVSPLPCPDLVPPSLTSGGLLRLMVRVIYGSQWELPRRVCLRGPLTPPAHRTIWWSWTSLLDPRTGQGPASRSKHQWCRSMSSQVQDLFNLTAHLSVESVQSMLNCLESTLLSHVATRPPSPPLESEISEVTSCRSYPRQAQSCSWRALT